MTDAGGHVMDTRGSSRTAREICNHIVAAAGALAAIAEEVALLNRGRETGHEQAVDWIYGERLMLPTEEQPSSGKAHYK
jgi:hypothetical protein